MGALPRSRSAERQEGTRGPEARADTNADRGVGGHPKAVRLFGWASTEPSQSELLLEFAPQARGSGASQS